MGLPGRRVEVWCPVHAATHGLPPGNVRRPRRVRHCLRGAGAAAVVEWLLWRKDITLAWRSLTPDGARALDVCDRGGCFADLCEVLCETGDGQHAPMRAAGLLRQWLVDGLLRAV